MFTKKGGIPSAGNVGIASGDLISFIDSDDYLQCDMYQNLLEKTDKTNSDIVISRYNIVRNRIQRKIIRYVKDTCLAGKKS